MCEAYAGGTGCLPESISFDGRRILLLREEAPLLRYVKLVSSEDLIRKLTLNQQWLPNQLSAVMDLMISIYDTCLAPSQASNGQNGHVNGYDESYRKQVEPIMELVHDQREKLAKEVDRWCKERGV